MNIWQSVVGRLASTKLGARIVRDPRFRMVFMAAIGFAVNLLYALYHGILGAVNLSLWFLTMCAYYTVLGAMRLSAVLCAYKNGSAASGDTEYFVMKLSGVLLILLSFVLTGVIYISLSQNIAAKYDEILMITIATYTFYKVTMAIVKAVKQHRDPSPLLAVIRSIGYAEAAGSLLTLQRSMLVSFGAMRAAKVHCMNALTGAAVCLFVLALGIFMTIRGKRKDKILWQNPSL